MIKNKRGIALLIVISLILMLLVLGGAVLMISVGHFGTSHQQVERARALYAAEAAMQHVLWKLRTNQPAPNALPSNFEVNRIRASDINIIIGSANPAGTNPEGCRPIDITVTY